MEKTDAGTSVGVDDPYDYVDRCDHLTDDGRCRFALEQRSMSPGSHTCQDAVEQGDRDSSFVDERSREDFRCPVAGKTDEEGEPYHHPGVQQNQLFALRTHRFDCCRRLFTGPSVEMRRTVRRLLWSTAGGLSRPDRTRRPSRTAGGLPRYPPQ